MSPVHAFFDSGRSIVTVATCSVALDADVRMVRRGVPAALTVLGLGRGRRLRPICVEVCRWASSSPRPSSVSGRPHEPGPTSPRWATRCVSEHRRRRSVRLELGQRAGDQPAARVEQGGLRFRDVEADTVGEREHRVGADDDAERTARAGRRPRRGAGRGAARRRARSDGCADLRGPGSVRRYGRLRPR